MPRNPRENVEDGIYHVYARGNDRQSIYVDDRDRRTYLLILSDVCDEFAWRKLAYCLMNNHVHLLLETPKANLSEGMQRLQTRYSQRFNRRHERTGHLFGARFGAVRITSDKQFVAATAYIARNPVEAGLCETPELWPWTNCEEARKRCAAMAANGATAITRELQSAA